MKAVLKFVTAAVLAIAPVAAVAGTAAAAEAPAASNTSSGRSAEQSAYLKTLPALSELNSGPYVLALQARLIRSGYDLEGTGFFGPDTHAAVADWQAVHGINPSGHVGIQTWASLLGSDFFVPGDIQVQNMQPGDWFESEEHEWGSVAGTIMDLQWIFPKWAHVSTRFTTDTTTAERVQYDQQTADAVADLQWRVGLFPSGQLGPQTTAALGLIDALAFNRGIDQFG